ncbi:MAG: sensor histidine kinase [Bacteroidetes bacterium]|nr:sensor histidine kinase [Bacteroidota bacterium]
MIKKILLSASNSGVNANQTIFFTDKLIARNHFALICAVFSTVYLFYFLKNDFFIGSICISISITFFVLSIICNYLEYYSLSKTIIILVTNFSVLFTSMLFGFNSGFHIYLLTSPLITFMLFEPKQRLIIFLSILSYCLNFFALILLYKYYNFESPIVQPEQSNIMYLLNFTFTIFIIITLLFYYSYNNLNVNMLLNKKNEVLLDQQTILKNEISIRERAETELVSLLADKSLLLKEINHRVKNNLAIISALLELENTYTNDSTLNNAIKDSNNRIKAIALLHEQQYQDKNTGNVNISEYLKLLKQNIINTYSIKNKDIEINCNVDEVFLASDVALPIALMLNELIVGSVKHYNLYSKNKTIFIELKNLKNTVTILYTDNFLRDEHFINNYYKSYAFNLIDSLSSQLNGVSSFNLQEGMSFKLTFYG